MIVDCPNCGAHTRFTLKLTNKMNLKCICPLCGNGFKVKLAKSEWDKPVPKGIKIL